MVSLKIYQILMGIGGYFDRNLDIAFKTSHPLSTFKIRVLKKSTIDGKTPVL